jgi:O-methyltransferase involved in polyketide biosynthesis
MGEKHRVRLGAVQETLFIPLAGRAREARKRRPVLRDPKAVELVESVEFDDAKYGKGAGGLVTVLRTAIFDTWVSEFLDEHPAGTVVEIGAGLNTRFERVDNGRVHWFDMDLPDMIELRGRFFADSERRHTLTASVLDESWPRAVLDSPGPYFLVAEGVLVYLDEEEVTRALGRIAERFPGALVAFDTYGRRIFEQQHRMAAKRDMARWAWCCDDPRSLERLGLRLVDSATVARPPERLRARLPARYRYLLPLADPVMRGLVGLNLFRADG